MRRFIFTIVQNKCSFSATASPFRLLALNASAFAKHHEQLAFWTAIPKRRRKTKQNSALLPDDRS
jgi:hypothetical protein